MTVSAGKPSGPGTPVNRTDNSSRSGILPMQYIVGVDIGGTFTDCVVTDTEGTLTLGKALSTPEDFSIGAIHAVRDAARNLGLNSEQDLLALTRLFFHACTVGDNTLVTRTGVKAG